MKAMKAYAGRTDLLRAEGAYQVLARAQALEAAGRRIIHFEIGQPDFDTFANISQAGITAIKQGRTRYTPPSGMPALKEAIAKAAGARRGMQFLPEQVVISPGAKPNLFFTALALIEPGDEVLYPDPGFPTYKAMVDVAGGKSIPVPLTEQNDFSFDLQAFDRLISDRTRLIILNSPSNPTGSVIPQADLQHIAKAAQKHDCWVLTDEIYAGIVYDGKTAPSIAALPGMRERTVIVDGFSKTYAMTGWRLGYGIMPVQLAQRLDLLLTHSVGCSAHFTQVAGLEAITGSQDRATEMVDEYQYRRDLIVSALNSIAGVRCRKPQGAFYVFPNISSYGMTSAALGDFLLEEAGVAVLPGSAFGGQGEGYLRLSYATSRENIRSGLEQLQKALGGIQ